MSSSVSGGRASPAGKAASRAAAPVGWAGREARSPVADNDAGDPADRLPPIRWDQLESVMMAMAVSPDRRAMVLHLLHGARRNAENATVEETVREILCIAAALGGLEPAAPAA